MFLSKSLLVYCWCIGNRGVEKAGETIHNFLNIVLTVTELCVSTVDPPDVCRSLGPNCFAIHVCIQGLEVEENLAFQFSGLDGTLETYNYFDALKTVTLVPGREDNTMEK